MKLFFTRKQASIRFAAVALLALLITLPGISQTTHEVAVTNNVYTPKNITINVGDKIVWTCTEGNHNVNALQSTFPSNPESFGNDVSADWVFEHTFNTVGSYDYQCDPHATYFGMVGTIEVLEGVTATNFSPNAGMLKVFPNPTDAYLNIQSDKDYSVNSIKLYNTAGVLVMSASFDEGSLKVIDMSRLASGLYIIEVKGENKSERLKILKQ